MPPGYLKNTALVDTLSKRMPRLDYKRCRVCGRFAKDVGPLSHTRLCPDHSRELLAENIVQMEARSGPNFTKWRLGMIRCAGGHLADSRSLTP